jgi:hypothetical protein
MRKPSQKSDFATEGRAEVQFLEETGSFLYPEPDESNPSHPILSL